MEKQLDSVQKDNERVEVENFSLTGLSKYWQEEYLQINSKHQSLLESVKGEQGWPNSLTRYID